LIKSQKPAVNDDFMHEHFKTRSLSAYYNNLGGNLTSCAEIMK